jgi:hypothetical protein
MSVQSFKGDALETKMQAVMEPAFSQVGLALDSFEEEGGISDPFLLMLYDEGRVPFSERIGRNVFVSFIKKALENFPFIGNFESYIFILKEIFGPESNIFFEILAPGKLKISIDSAIDVVFDFIGRELVSGDFETFSLTTKDGYSLQFRGILGIDSQYELSLLFAEIMPAGLAPTVAFFTLYEFFTDAGDNVLDSFGNQIVFYELGS